MLIVEYISLFLWNYFFFLSNNCGKLELKTKTIINIYISHDCYSINVGLFHLKRPWAIFKNIYFSQNFVLNLKLFSLQEVFKNQISFKKLNIMRQVFKWL